jgi:hypothetical protein
LSPCMCARPCRSTEYLEYVCGKRLPRILPTRESSGAEALGSSEHQFIFWKELTLEIFSKMKVRDIYLYARLQQSPKEVTGLTIDATLLAILNRPQF